MPPPTPWKVFVFAAGVFEMKMASFMLAVFAGRIVRFGVLCLLTIHYGPQIVHDLIILMHQHMLAVLGAPGVILVVLAVLALRKGMRPKRSYSQRIAAMGSMLAARNAGSREAALRSRPAARWSPQRSTDCAPMFHRGSWRAPAKPATPQSGRPPCLRRRRPHSDGRSGMRPGCAGAERHANTNLAGATGSWYASVP